MELTNIQKLMSKNMSHFAKSVLEPIAYDDDRSARYPEEAIRKMAENDFLGLAVPEDFGGSPVDFITVALLAEAFGNSNGAAASVAITHIVSVTDTIVKYGTSEQKEKYLPDMKSGKKLGGYALAEPNAALSSGENKVNATKNGNEYYLSGKKTYVANGGAADVYIVIAEIAAEEGQKNISAFIVDGKDVKVNNKIDKLGLRSFPTAEIELINTKATLLGNENEGLKIASDIQAKIDIAAAAIAVGIGQAALDETVKHCKTRVQFGSPIGKLQAVQWMLAEMATNLHALKTLTFNAAVNVDENGDYLKEAAFLKMFARKAAFEIGTNAVQIHGGTGYSREAKIERYFRDLKGLFIVENANEYPEKIIAQNLLK